MFWQKGVLKNIAKFTGKHPCQSLFFNKAGGLRRGERCCNMITALLGQNDPGCCVGFQDENRTKNFSK